MPKLVIKRANEFMNVTRKMGIYFDGKKLGTIANNATQTYEIAAGSHTLNAKIDWCGSRDYQFSINEGETKYVKLSGIPYANPILLIWAALFVINIMVVFSTGRNFLLYFSIPFAALLIYYFTVGRNDYIKIREHDQYL
jgi:hypothetical protein